ncbi:hypothetical protein [Glaesserella parasuis]|uniref:hypothetical protein n=2 Tax=Glaesserella parasuis TaxID=738 RepID=UPI0004330F18|nr:hypothetical protein [Glaesserella parasuis]ATW45325.1 hypothetical protein A2U21_04940 [Glaesserella parasuis str. Nagasaki]EYE73166.1 hypothetical protein HPNK_00602 [Glaesserella parasuis str. Nagasaki]MDG6334191.1 hypothetical protein [Glaesserella parasuis]MDP0070119.1 hypothetical protein [Glaesserella parasuis]MDP0246024.1 hypothetical protein [Glaesserella parasuis]
MTKFIPLHFIGFVDEGFKDENGIYRPYIDTVLFDKIYISVDQIWSFKRNIDDELNVPKLSIFNTEEVDNKNDAMEFVVDNFATYSPSDFKEATSIIYFKDYFADMLNSFIWINSAYNPQREKNGTEGYIRFLVYESPEEIMALMKE